MPPKPPDPSRVATARRLVEQERMTLTEAADRMAMPRPTLQGWKRANWWDEPVHEGQDFTAPDLVDPDPPVEEIIRRARANFERRHAAKKSREWMRYSLKSDKPFGLAFVGDPHLDDNGTNWPLLEDHITLLNRTKGVYGVGMGDWLNNWSGRLQALYKDQEVTASQGWKLAAWFFQALPWMVLIKGNHDLWSTMKGNGDPLDWMARGPAALEDWQARFIVETPNGAEFRIHARHDYKGHSQWNELHGLAKAAKFGDEADILVAGHRHEWAVTRGEHNGHVHTLIRTRGYKYLDEYADRHQFESQKEGATIFVICDPNQMGSAKTTVFEDLAKGVAVLKLMRGDK